MQNFVFVLQNLASCKRLPRELSECGNLKKNFNCNLFNKYEQIEWLCRPKIMWNFGKRRRRDGHISGGLELKNKLQMDNESYLCFLFRTHSTPVKSRITSFMNGKTSHGHSLLLIEGTLAQQWISSATKKFFYASDIVYNVTSFSHVRWNELSIYINIILAHQTLQ